MEAELTPLRLGVVVLRISATTNIHVRASDIQFAKSVLGPTPAEIAANEAMHLQMLRAMRDYHNPRGLEVIGGEPIATPAQPRALRVYVRLRGQAEWLAVLNSIEEIDGWMRNA